MEKRIAPDAVAANKATGFDAAMTEIGKPGTVPTELIFKMQDIIDELETLLEYDDRKPPNWHGMIGHFNIDDDAVIITASYATPREGCNHQRLQITPAKKCGVSLSGWDELGRPISRVIPEIDMKLALEKVLSGARAGHRSGEWFAKFLIHGDVDWLSQ